MLNALLKNNYLLPEGSTNVMQFTDSTDDTYRLYCNQYRDYICIYLNEIATLTASRQSSGAWSFGIKGDLFDVPNNTIITQRRKMVHLLERVYGEIFSFDPDEVKVKEIKRDISDYKKLIAEKKRETKALEKRIIDAKKIISELTA